PRALGVAQELVAEALALRGARDEAGKIRDDEGALDVHAHDAERGGQRRERIVGDLRGGGGESRHQRGLPGVRKADDADIREELQLEVEPPAVAGTPEV